ncbi:T-cell surface glycoprotein CD3 epsilon chain-like [Embiotoca jacksoni]|uniref:T-cell surface glycoprotein CD3 epsilon chain-like n=1 Tax=Embiotoca jacksoni TaxID=100190 RepID=UPI0037048853
MHSIGVQAVLVVVLMFTATAKSDGGYVAFWMDKVELTCPGEGSWFKDKVSIPNDQKEKYTFDYTDKSNYHCEYDETKSYQFYVMGKTCDKCFELNGTVFAVAIVVDVVGTAFLMWIIFRCTKKKSSAGPTHSSKAPARPGATAPPGSSSEYESLNLQNVSQGTYSVVNRTG